MAMEYRIGARVVQRHDFLEGVLPSIPSDLLKLLQPTVGSHDIGHQLIGSNQVLSQE
jgi:hypothetical protein